MAMAYCFSFIKYILSFLNIIFMTLGVCAISFASWMLWEGSGQVGSGAGKRADGVAALGALAAWGLVLALSAMLTLAGVVRRGRVRLGLGAAALALLVVAETAALWWGATHLPQLRVALRDRFKVMVKHEYGVVDTSSHVIDAIQKELQCCGVEGPRDYGSLTWVQATEGGGEGGEEVEGAAIDLTVSAPMEQVLVPSSCCEQPSCDRVVSVGDIGMHGVWVAPCLPKAMAALERGAGVALAALAALLTAQGVTLLLAALHYVALAPVDHYKA